MNEPSIPVVEMLKSIPEFFGLRVNEEPHYTVVEHADGFEVRQYSPQIRARVTAEAMGAEEFREHAFKKLANYIFGGNMKRVKLPMTAPVLRTSEGRNRTMWFILPAKFTLAHAPRPLDPDVQLEEMPSQTFAVLKYSGPNSEEQIADHHVQLLQCLEKYGGYAADSDAIVAQYDGPFSLPFVRRNEILVRVSAVPRH